ncbi:hypothetical protein ACLB2K_013368 [Fragaria x ananassa]
MQHKRQNQYHHNNREEDETQQGSKSRNRIPSRKWSEKLPQDIMHSILQRLCTSDYLRCRAVCHSWRSAALDLAMSARKLGARVILPSETTIPDHRRSLLNKVVASSVTTRPHCLVAFHCYGCGRLAFCKPTDKSCTLIEAEAEADQLDVDYVHDVELIDRKIYALTKNAWFDIELDGNSGQHTYTVESHHLCSADPTDGVTLVPLTDENFDLQKPYNEPLDDRYSYKDGVRSFWIYNNDKPFKTDSTTRPRSELRIKGHDYSSGIWQFEGYAYVPSGTSGVYNSADSWGN